MRSMVRTVSSERMTLMRFVMDSELRSLQHIIYTLRMYVNQHQQLRTAYASASLHVFRRLPLRPRVVLRGEAHAIADRWVVFEPDSIRKSL